jgi:predicted component of type VI protein secretion system
MSKPPKQLKGRPATDARGNPTWKWVGENETVETAAVRALGEGLSLEPLPENVNLDPYSQSGSQRKEETKGRSLDDMRRLDEEMKRAHEKLVEGLRKGTFRKSDTQPTRAVRLRLNDRELLVEKHNSSITIGRGEDNDVVLTGERISRLHARIQISRNTIVLIDESMNGTYVQTADGKESFIHRNSVQLEGQGMIGFGRRPRQDSPRTIRFSCKDA